MVVEGLALAAFHNMRRATSCDLLRQLTELVLRDEARHVAFGNLYVKEAISDMQSDDREDMAQFAFEVVKKMSDAFGGPDGRGPQMPDPGFLTVLEQVEIDPQDFLKSVIEAGEAGLQHDTPPGEIHSFKDLMMPALVRVGAITERTRELFAAEGIPVWDDVTVLESMENAEDGNIEIPVG